jgi:hypothetical protein
MLGWTGLRLIEVLGLILVVSGPVICPRLLKRELLPVAAVAAAPVRCMRLVFF